MLHQTQISPSSSRLFPFNPSTTSSFSSIPLPVCPLQSPPHFHSAQVEKDRRMEDALKSSLRSEPLAASGQQDHQGLLADDLAWAVVERGNLLLGEGFSVDELLDLGEFAEPEKEMEEKPDAGAGYAKAEENSNSSSSSALSFEPPPLSEISLPISPLPLMAQDVEELEWVSLIIDDSLSEFPPSCSGVAPTFPPPPPPPPAKPQANSPPENQRTSSRSPTACALSTEALVPVKAKRSKRSRSAAAGWSLSGPPPFADSSTTTTTSSSSSCSSSSSSFESYLIYEPAAALAVAAGEYNLFLDGLPPPPAQTFKKHKSKKRGRKPKQVASAGAAAGGGERRCSHCGVQKTPQWRAGPLGAKTLCNACGVRYKSGRLLPEYRPACSPTFISNVHSNSHRKVLEMRRKKEGELLAATTLPVPSF